MHVWLILGLLLMATEIVLPGLVAGSLGIAALVSGLLAWLGIPFYGQILSWIVLSPLLLLWGRRLIPRNARELEESRDARAITSIPAGAKGRVSYLGSTWPARCSLPNVVIEADQDLFVVERQGNLLIVIPSHLLTPSNP